MTEKLPRSLRNILSLHDFERVARQRLPRPLFGFISGAAEDNRTFDANLGAFKTYAFKPRVMNDVSTRDKRVSIFGKTYSSPIGVAPIGISAMSAYRGDIVLARAAAAEGIAAVMSGTSLIRMEDVHAAAPGCWYQAYLPGEQAQIDDLIDRVGAAGFTTLVVTVDTPVRANRENNVRTGFSMPLRPSLRLAVDGALRPGWFMGTLMRTLVNHGMPHFENTLAARGAPVLSNAALRHTTGHPHLSWLHLERIRKRWNGTFVAKGILSEEDALIAADIGLDGVIVSNHGGRQLDGTIAALKALPGVVNAVGDRMTVMMDGGVRRGSDVLTALALGAKMVFVGRPFMYAAAVASEKGVRHAIGLLQDEVDRNMAMLGVRSIGEITREHLS